MGAVSCSPSSLLDSFKLVKIVANDKRSVATGAAFGLADDGGVETMAGLDSVPLGVACPTGDRLLDTPPLGCIGVFALKGPATLVGVTVVGSSAMGTDRS